MHAHSCITGPTHVILHHPVSAQCRKWRLPVVTSATPYLLQQSMASWSRKLPPGCAIAATPAWHAFSTESPQEKGKNASLASTEPCTAFFQLSALMGHCSMRSLYADAGNEAAAAAVVKNMQDIACCLQSSHNLSVLSLERGESDSGRPDDESHLGLLCSLLQRNLCTLDSVGLPTAHAQEAPVLGDRDGIALHMLHYAPGKAQVLQLLLCGLCV